MSATVIVGASVAGVRAAQALRSEGYDGSIVLLSEEEELPYDKPPLSKGFLGGGEPRQSLTLMTEEDAAAQRIDLILGRRAVGLDVAEHLVLTDGPRPLPYDNLIIATGGRPRPSPWGQQPGIHVLRTLQDSLRLRQDLVPGAHLAVIGAGFIGAEVAATARAKGMDVTLIDPLIYPMSRVLSPEVGAWFARLHNERGVRTRFGVGVEALSGERGNFHLRLTDGTTLRADTVLVGIGSVPNDEWLSSSGLLIDDGVVCDEYCRAVDSPDVFASGDVARWAHPDRQGDTRVEHWTNAVEMAQVAAHNIAHPSDLRAYAPVEYVWSDQYDWKVQMVGASGRHLDQTIIGDPFNDGRAIAVFSMQDELYGAAIVNWPRALLEARRAIADRMRTTDLTARIEDLWARSVPTRP